MEHARNSGKCLGFSERLFAGGRTLFERDALDFFVSYFWRLMRIIQPNRFRFILYPKGPIQ